MNVNRNLRSLYSVIRISDFGFGLPAILALALAPLSSSAQPTNRPVRPDFSAFKSINQRNIFNPSRSAKYTPSMPTQTRRPRRVDSVALVGTMSYDAQGPLAFFDGTASEYRRVLKTSDTIAGYKIADIEPACVKLVVGTNEFQLRVGMELRREDQGKWHLAERTEPPSERSDRTASVRPAPLPPGPRPGPPAAATNSEAQAIAFNPDFQAPLADPPAEAGAANAAPGAASGGSEDDVLARLMQRRRQQTDP